MINDDRTHTTSWDGREVQRQAEQRAARTTGESTGAKKKKKKKKKHTNPLLALVIWLVVVGVSSMAFASVGWMLANDFAALNKGPYAKVEFDFPKEAWVKEVVEETDEDGNVEEVTHYDMKQVAAGLKEKGLIEYEWFFRLFAWFYHGDVKVGPGTYELNTEMDYMALIRGMHPVALATTVDVSIPEGYSVSQIIQLLAEKGVGTVEEMTDIAENTVFSYEFVDNENLGDISRLEGYLFPDTYNFYVGRDPLLAFNAMLSNFNQKVYENADLAELFDSSEYSLKEILTIASLIEKETDGTDWDRISSVIYNRLHNNGETHYLLQIDAALVYAAGREITQADYETLDSPYNLYQHTGLPPTPICNPGLSSIGAALQPAETNYYFYVRGADGKHIFSETLAEHNRNIAAVAAGN